MYQPQNHPKLHFLMFPWFAYGHITPYLHLSNELAKRGHKITFLSPTSDQAKHRLQTLNHHPTLITFIPLHLPHIPGLPSSAVTASDIPIERATLLATAVDQTRSQVEEIISKLRPDFVIYDFAHWISHITSNLGIISVCYNVISAATLALTCVPAAAARYKHKESSTKANLTKEQQLDEAATPPPGYPSSKVVLRRHEAKSMTLVWDVFGEGGMTLQDRLISAMRSCNAMAVRTCREIEGQFCDYLSAQFDHRPVLLTGPVLPLDTSMILNERWVEWLGQFRDGEVVYCAFGSQVIFEKEQLMEILHGLEMTGLPFFAVLSPPRGWLRINDVLPEGFMDRVVIRGRGVVYDGWVEQPAILNHSAVGCFVNHCGFGTMWEGMRSECQIVLAPQLVDQILNTRIMAEEMGVAVEVKRGENGWISREDLCEAVKLVMDKGSEVGDLVRKNHAKWRERLCSEGFMEGYVDDFVMSLEGLVTQKKIATVTTTS